MEFSSKVVAGLVLCAVVFQLSSSAPADNKPKICRDYECPRFTNESVSNDYVLRKYKGGATWIRTTYNRKIFANYILFMRLFYYINGANVDDKKFDMTVPVVMNTKGTDKTMWFYLGTGEYPKANNDVVEVVTVKEFEVYVWGYDEIFPNWAANEIKLRDSLNKDGASYDQSSSYRVGYSRPMDIIHKHKEIWYLKTNSQF